MSRPAFYIRDGDRYTPTGVVENPWFAGAQSGVALAGLVGHVITAVPDPTPMLTARLVIDILGVVSDGPLDATTRIVREGRRLRLIEAELSSEGRPRVRATAMRVRAGSSPDAAPPLRRALPEGEPAQMRAWFETVRVAGSFETPGPGARWLRMTADVVAGEPLAPLSKAAIFADFGTGTAPLVPPADWTFANIDIALHLTREPRGERTLLDAESQGSGNGVGLTTSRLGDTDGMFGIAHQTSFLERR